jgi:hypothetical protein
MKEVWANFASLERIDEYAVRATAKQPLEVGLAHRQWQVS